MRALFVTYPRIGLGKGGLQVQIQRTAEELSKQDVEVLFFDPWKDQTPEVDIVHLFSLDGTLVYHARHAHKSGLPIVVSPVFNAFAVPPAIAVLRSRLSQYIPALYTDLRRAAETLRYATKVVALNEEESRLLGRAFGVENHRQAVIPNGVDVRFRNADPTLFRQHFGLSDFVLQVGSIEPRKNQLASIRAAKGQPFDLVLIGGASAGNEGYLEQCKREAGQNVHFLGHIQHNDPLLASAFASSRVFVLPSYSEVMPLTLYEAAVAGCHLITSHNVPVSAELSDRVKRVHASDSSRLRREITTALSTANASPHGVQAVRLASWQDVATQLKRLYNEASGALRN